MKYRMMNITFHYFERKEDSFHTNIVLATMPFSISLNLKTRSSCHGKCAGKVTSTIYTIYSQKFCPDKVV